MRVLVAEDSLPNRRLLIKLLQSMQCEAVGVEDGHQCCDRILSVHDSDGAAAAAPPFDCIIMDGCMPVMDGLEATRKLRAAHCNIPILGCQSDCKYTHAVVIDLVCERRS